MMKILAAVFVAVTLAGCGQPKPIIRSQANPDPFAGQRDYLIQHVTSASDLRVGPTPEPEYLARKTDEQRAEFTGDKMALDDAFATALQETLADHGVRASRDGDHAFAVQPQLTWIEPGYYAVMAAGNGEAKLTVTFAAANGGAPDVIELHAKMPGFTVRQRLSRVGAELGKMAGKYLLARVEK